MDNNVFMTVDETAKLLKTTPKTLYTYLCNSGTKNGAKRKRFPEYIYVKMGRKVLFIKDKLMEWALSGAELTYNQSS